MNQSNSAAIEVTFRRSFWIALSCNFLLLPIYFEDLRVPRLIYLAICVGMIYGTTTFLWSLAKLSILAGRSWITWVGLALLFAPIGPVVAYIKMSKILAANSFMVHPPVRPY
jgi:hypothetical protein